MEFCNLVEECKIKKEKRRYEELKGFLDSEEVLTLGYLEEKFGHQIGLPALEQLNYISSASKYKSVDKKVRPFNAPKPQTLNPPLKRPPLSRDPYQTPLTPYPPEFTPIFKVTRDRLEMVNFGPNGFLST